MKNLLEIDHIGYAVRDIQETAAPYVAAGWHLSEACDEQVQKAKIAFLTKPGMTTIELVAPLSEGGGGTCRQDTSFSRSGAIPYLLWGRGYLGSNRESTPREFCPIVYAG